jgi:predicted glutamine amidotransferase
MCELFAMSARRPATVRLSLEEFSAHGGLSGPHKDGWGIAWYEDGDLRLVKENVSASRSACLRFIQDTPPQSRTVLSHIRKATQGRPRLANCQPFQRELGGRIHAFAHNGNLDATRLRALQAIETYQPVGDTDSEIAFCALLERMRMAWRASGGMPPLEARLAVVRAFALALRALGPANFLYADGDALFVHGDRRTQRDGTIVPPGLHTLSRHCAGEPASYDIPGLSVEHDDSGEQQVTLVASVPLSAESGWQPLAEGELLALRDGVIVAHA